MNFTIDVDVSESRVVNFRLPEELPIGHYRVEVTESPAHGEFEVHLDPAYLDMRYSPANEDGLRMAKLERSGIVRELCGNRAGSGTQSRRV